jgi:hypothetical protein
MGLVCGLGTYGTIIAVHHVQALRSKDGNVIPCRGGEVVMARWQIHVIARGIIVIYHNLLCSAAFALIPSFENP